MNMAKLQQMFGFHPATEETRPKYERLRDLTMKYADAVTDIIPEGREASMFLTNLQYASMSATAAIAMTVPLGENYFQTDLREGKGT